MTAATVPPITEWVAPGTWRAVDCLSDLHLDAAHPVTLKALRDYLDRTRADAVLLLGDLFEVWVGDDAILEAGGFEGEVCALLRRAAERRPMAFMHGNRDFLIGGGFMRATGITLLVDPTVLVLGETRWLLSHGDALCLDDVPYQQFRTLVRSHDWQARWLAQPLAARRAQARGIRDESQSRKQAQTVWVDIDRAAALAWLAAAHAPALVHGHTHRPADELLAPGAVRHVLTDWDLDAPPTRAEILRLSREGARRVAPEAA